MTRVVNIDVRRLRLAPGSTVLDYGCGRGGNAIALAARGLKVTGADVRQEVLDDMIGAARGAGVTVEPVLLSQSGGVLAADTFDAVVCTEVLEHVADHRAVIRDLVAKVRPGGTLCISVPSASTEVVLHRLLPTYVEDSTHVQVLTRSILEHHLREAGVAVDHVEGRNVEWTVFWLIHGVARTRFDHTGAPIEHHGITRAFWRMVGGLMRIRAYRPLLALGNRIAPKSIYLYCTKPDTLPDGQRPLSA